MFCKGSRVLPFAFTIKQFIPEMEEEVINIKKGEETIIKLKGLSSAGYTWILDDNWQNLLQIEKKYFLPDATKQGIDSVSAEEHFHVKAVASGEVELHFQQKREWQKGKAPSALKNIRVKVSG